MTTIDREDKVSSPPAPEHHPTRNIMEMVLQGIEDLRAGQATQGGKVDKLSVKLDEMQADHAVQRTTLRTVANEVSQLAKRVDSVEGVARQASEAAKTADASARTTKGVLEGTLAALNSTTGGLASTTKDVAVETKVQTTSLARLEAVNLEQSKEITKVASKMGRVQLYTPLLTAVAVGVATALAAAFDTWSRLRHP